MSRYTVKLPATALFMVCAIAANAITPEEQQILDRHNQLRALHGAAPLTWSPVLAAQAESWANSCSMNHAGQRNGAGENLAMWSGDQSMPNMVQMWYDEVKFYDYNKPGFTMATGHFTQVVWRASKELGCAKQVCPRSPLKAWLVCRYLPSGNITNAEQFKTNVTSASGAPPPASPPPTQSVQGNGPKAPVGGRFPLRAGTTIAQNRKYRSESGNHYLVFQPDGNLVVYDASDRYVWGLQSVTPKYNQVKIAEVQPDGNLAVYGANRAYVWSALTRDPDPTSYLTLTPQGVLRLVSGKTGATLWASR